MDFTHIPEALLYKRKSVDKFAMLHPLNAVVFKRLMKMDGWDKNYSREIQILPCMNNAYYICTIMRLEYDATFREDSYKSIARGRYIEGSHTFIECVTLSLVILLIEHSTPEWRQKLQEVSDDLLKYVFCLYAVRKKDLSSVLDVETLNEDLLKNLPAYLLKEMDDSWVLPDDLFQPRALDEKAIFDMHRQVSSFNWDRYNYHHDEDDIREMVEKLGQTPQEKAILIRSFWKDIYNSRKKNDGPIKDTWQFLKTLAQDFCPEYMEMTELHKIPETGIEFERRISELEAEVTRLEKQLGNVNSEASSELETQVEKQQDESEILQEENASTTSDEQFQIELNRIKKLHEDTLVELLTPSFFNSEVDARAFLRCIQGLDNQGVTDVAKQFLHDSKITPSLKGRPIWKVLKAAKLYYATEQNWTAALRKAN